MTIDDEKILIRDYTSEAGCLKMLESNLTAALDRLADARKNGTPFEVTPARKRAEHADKDCRAGWDSVETARRAYWLAKAAKAEKELEALAMPLLAAIEFCHKAGGSRGSSPGVALLSKLGCLPRPPYAPITPVPALPEISAAIERSDNEV